MPKVLRGVIALTVAALTLAGCAKASGPAVQDFQAKVKNGMADVTSYEGSMSMDIDGSASGSMTGTLSGTVRNGAAVDGQASIRVEAGSQKVAVEVVMIGSKVYVGGSTILDAIPAAEGKQWIYADSGSSNPTVRQLSGSITAASTSSIAGMVAFADASRSISNEGSSTVGGVQTTEYSVDLDPAKIPSTGAGAARPDSVEASFFLDDQDRMRRVRIEMSFDGADATLTMDITGYNTDVRIDEPEADTVYRDN